MSPGTTRRRSWALGGLALGVGIVAAVGAVGAVAVWPSDDTASAGADRAPVPAEVQTLGGDLVAGVPSVQRSVAGETAVTAAVGPATPGENLVRLDVTGAPAGHDGGHGTAHGSEDGSHDGAGAPLLVSSGAAAPVEARAVPGTDGLWARVELAPGQDRLVVERDGVSHAFDVTTGRPRDVSAAWRGADAPECLSAAVGSLAAGERPDPGVCPSDSLPRDEAATLTETVETLATRGVERLAVNADDSARSRVALDAVRTAAGDAGVRVVDADAPADGRTALLDVAGWETSAESLAAVSRLPVEEQPVRSDGTWLAPWLLAQGVVDSTSGAVLPLDFDIRSADALRYADVLRTLLPGQAPTASGYAAWADARDTPAEPVQLYAASRASVLMSEPGTDGSGGHAAHATQISWFPGGTITPVGTLAAARPSTPETPSQ